MIKVALSMILLVNAFAGNPPPKTIVTTRAPCAWGIGLATTPGGNGTAFIIGNRRELLTNMHVVDKHCLGNRRFTFSHGFDLDHALSTVPATVVVHGDYCAGAAGGHHDYGGDWAIAVLDRDPAAVEHGSPPRLLEPRTDDNVRNDNGHYFLLGYGMLFRGGYHPYRAGPCRFGRLYTNGLAEHDCDTSPRSSGAAIVSQDASGQCVVAALNEGELSITLGRPAYRAGVNANVAVLATRFAPAVAAVARELERGRNAKEIAADLAAHPPER
ncbi:MAG TPA: hypothetical protein VH020_00990 [Stellaceae bacterium]|jgi:hypothetical protein|nr:hypothetical protein [Stellaceae bacterium]